MAPWVCAPRTLMRRVWDEAMAPPARYPMTPVVVGHDMQAEDGVGPRVLQNTLLDHEGRPTTLTRRSPLLCRLEDELHRAREPFPHTRQDLGQPP